MCITFRICFALPLYNHHHYTINHHPFIRPMSPPHPHNCTCPSPTSPPPPTHAIFSSVLSTHFKFITIAVYFMINRCTRWASFLLLTVAVATQPFYHYHSEFCQQHLLLLSVRPSVRCYFCRSFFLSFSLPRVSPNPKSIPFRV